MIVSPQGHCKVRRRRQRALISPVMVAIVLAAAFECAAPRASLAQNTQQTPPPQQPMMLSASRGFRTPAVVLQNAPIMLLPDSTRLPLRIAQTGSQLRVIQQSGEWSTVQFQDPD